jgi:hypothetical protein
VRGGQTTICLSGEGLFERNRLQQPIRCAFLQEDHRWRRAENRLNSC